MSRIYYVEPNDVLGRTENGIPLTPDYSDLCMSFNLVAEVTNRHNLIGNVDTQYIMTWNSKPDENDPNSQGSKVSFLQGSDVEKYNYLTTYYTDIDYQDLLTSTTVEGLGVTSVSVQYDSWYMPQVTIEFCDILGSSLFGKEEVLHKDGILTSENVFGVFFTQPYPKFRMQMKGFYGDAITLQLMCSKFSGRFDSAKGYFLATVSFIGYNYSLLTDIPLNFLIASPYSTYFGRDYWDSKKSSPDWALSSGQEPPKLFDLLLEIKRAQLSISEDVNDYISVEESSRVTEIKNTINELEGISLHYKNLIDTVYGKSNSMFNEGSYTYAKYGEDLLLVVPREQSKKENIKFSNLFRGNQKEYLDAIDRYNEKDKLFTSETDFLYNRREPYSKDFHVVAYTAKRGDKYWDLLLSVYTPIKEDTKLEDTVSLNYYVVPLGRTLQIVDSRISELQKESDNIINSGISKANSEYEAMVSVKPYVGDIMKILFCHLETFIQMVLHCSSVIDNNPGSRTPSNLGVNPAQVTTLTNSGGSLDTIGPFPGVYDNSPRETAENIVNTHTEAWLGDFSQNYEEIKLIKGLYDASQMLNELSHTILERGEGSELEGLPVLPIDIKLGNPFKYVSTELTKNVSSFCGYVGNRFAQLSVLNFHGFAHNELNYFKYAGEADAINLYMAVGSSVLLNSQVLEPCISNGGIAKTILDVITCNKDGDKYGNKTKEGLTYHDFEINRSINKNRTPIFSLGNNNRLVYDYQKYKGAKNKVAYLPLLPYDQIAKKGIYDSEGNILKVRHRGQADEVMADPFCNVYPIENYIPEHNIQLYGGNKYSVALVKWDEALYKNSEIFMGMLGSETLRVNKGGIEINLKDRGLEKHFIYDLKTISPFWVSKCVSKTIKNKLIEQDDHIYQDNIGINDIKVSETDFTVFTDGDGKTELSISKGTIGVKYGGLDSSTENDGGLSYKACLYLIANQDESKYKTGSFDFEGDDGKNKFFWQKEERLGHLFTSEAYYSFNDTFPYDNLLVPELGIDSETNCQTKHRNRRKAYLLAHTFEFDYMRIYQSILFNRVEDKPFMIGLPIGYVWLIGAVLYRKEFNRLVKRQRNDILDFLDNPKLSNNENTERTMKLYYPNDSLTLLGEIINWGDNTYRMDYYILTLTNKKENVKHLYNIRIKDLIPIEHFDEDVKWCFIREFIDFSDNWFNTFSDQLEFKLNKSNNGEVFTDKHFRLLLKDLHTDYKSNDNYGTYSVGEYGFASNEIKGYYGGSIYAGGHGAVYGKKGKPESRNTLSKIPYYRDNMTPLDGKYSFLQYYKKKERLIALIDDDNVVQGLFADMYKKPVIFIISSNKSSRNTESREVVEKVVFDTYIQSFEQKLKQLCDISDNTISADDSGINKDIARSMYSNVKNIWDKWLIGLSDKSTFNVNPFFTTNFIFMDSFYKNIFKLFFLNYKKITDMYLSRRELGSTLYNFIGDIASAHNMLFLSMPDFNNIGHEEEAEALKNLESCFKPIPYHKMSNMEENNKFVFLYTHRPSSTALNNRSDLLENYNIWDYDTNDFTPIAHKLFNTPDNGKDQMTRFGYDVPSFGVAFGRQNNHLFKDISLNMDNPIQTEQSMLVLNDIVNLGASATNKVTFYGQDIYPIFSNYSYTCQIEMMGCAKIAPLMYFQLMNIPMWRGTYMITNVSHNITPGNFVTKFKGIKMSAKALPYNTNFVYSKDGGITTTVPPIDTDVQHLMSNDSGIQGSYPTVYDKDLKDYFSDAKYRAKSVKIEGVKEEVRSLFNRLFETIRKMNENKEPNKRYGVIITSAKREGNSKSQHITGHAIDLQTALYSNGFDNAPTKVYSSGVQQPFLVTVVSILVNNFLSEIYQLILEYPNGDVRQDNYGFHVLHIGVKNGNHKNSMVYIANDKNGSSVLGLKWEQYKNRIVPEFKYIMSKFYNNGYSNLRKMSSLFFNLSKIPDVTQEKLDEWFKGQEIPKQVKKYEIEHVSKSLTSCTKDNFYGIGNTWTFGKNGIDNNSINLYDLACTFIQNKGKVELLNQKYHNTFIEVFNALKSNGLTDYQAYGVMAHVMGESRFEYDVKNKKSGAAGLFQYLNSSGVFRSVGTKYGKYTQKEEPFGVKYVRNGKCRYDTASDVVKLTPTEQVDLYVSQLKYGYEKAIGWDMLKKTTNAIQALDVAIRFGYGIRNTNITNHLNGKHGEEIKQSYKNKVNLLVNSIPAIFKEIRG